MFPRKNIHKYIWISSDEKYRNQINYVLVTNSFKNGIVNGKKNKKKIKSSTWCGYTLITYYTWYLGKSETKKLMKNHQRKKAGRK